MPMHGKDLVETLVHSINPPCNRLTACCGEGTMIAVAEWQAEHGSMHRQQHVRTDCLEARQRSVPYCLQGPLLQLWVPPAPCSPVFRA